MIVRLLFIPLFIYLCSVPCRAQGADAATDKMVLEKIDSHLEQLNSLLFREKPIDVPNHHSKELNVDSIFNSSMDVFINAQKKAYIAQTGLSIRFSYNTQKGILVVDPSEEEIYPFKERMQVTLKWDALKSSIFGRKPAFKIVELEGLLHSYDFQKELQAISNQNQSLKSEQKWNAMISFVSLQRIYLLNEILGLKKHLYESQRALYGDVAEIQIEILNINSLITDIPADGASMQLLDVDKYQKNITFDTVGMFTTYINNSIELKQYPVEQQLLELSKKANSYFRQMDIDLYIKTQYFGSKISTKLNGNMNIGASVRFPLTLKYKRSKAVASHEILINKREQHYAHEGLIAIYNSKTKDLTELNNKLISEVAILQPIKQNILNRKMMYQNNLSSFEQLIFQYDTYLMVLANIYTTIKNREILIESLIN